MKQKKLSQDGFHLVYLLFALLVIVIIGAIGWRILSMQETKQGGAQKTSGIDRNDPFLKQYGNNCEDIATPTFTNAPVAVDQIRYIEPLGKMTDGHVTPTDHVYVSPLNPDAADNSYNVVMPADGKVVQVDAMPAQYIGDRAGQQVAPEDHRIVIAYNCRYFSIFIHVHKLSDALSKEVGTMAPNTQKQVAIPLKAGDPIGQIGGNPVDWTMVDAQTTLGFVTPKLYEGEPWKVHTIDPLSVYTGRIKEQVEAKSLRSAKPIGGKIDYDKKRTLQGNWFKVGTNGYMGSTPDRYWDGHLSVVPDFIDPNATVVSIGNWQGKAAQFAVKGDVNPSLATKQNSPVKYELIALNYETPEGVIWNGRVNGLIKPLKVSQRGQVVGTIMFEVQDGEKLRVEKFPGKTGTQVTNFTAAAETFER
jgi:hypothetical protein